MKIRLIPLFLLAGAVVTVASPRAGAGAGAGDDHERARAAVLAGQRLPLSSILAAIESRYGGRILEIELDDDNGRPIYEIELLDDRGRVLELEVDAATGEILDSEYDD